MRSLSSTTGSSIWPACSSRRRICGTFLSCLISQELVLTSVPCLFATVDYNGQEVPDVRFYTESEGGRDGAV